MQSPSHTIDRYGPQDIEEEVLLIVFIDGAENEFFDIEVCDWLVSFLDDVLLVDFVGLDDLVELLERVGVLGLIDSDGLRLDLGAFAFLTIEQSLL